MKSPREYIKQILEALIRLTEPDPLDHLEDLVSSGKYDDWGTPVPPEQEETEEERFH